MSEIYNGTFVLGNTSATTLSAGPGIKIDDSTPGVIKVSNDETVLWDGGTTGTSTYSTPNLVLSDNPFNYDVLKLYCSYQGPFEVAKEIQTNYIASHYNEFGIGDFCGDSPSTDALYIRDTWFKVNTSAISAYKATQAVIQNNSVTLQGPSQYAYVRMYKIVGCNRISGGN